MAWIEPLELSDATARLVPTSMDQAADLADAAADGALNDLWYTSVPAPDAVPQDIERRLKLQAAGSMVSFTVFVQGHDKAVGMTSYMHIDAPHRRLEIGSTWYAQTVQRTGLNTACKFLLLSHAFEQLGCIAVELRTHFMNRQSRQAIERLGAKLDGILRNHMIMPNGTLRDTCVYSMLATEWPAVAANLRHQMARRR